MKYLYCVSKAGRELEKYPLPIWRLFSVCMVLLHLPAHGQQPDTVQLQEVTVQGTPLARYATGSRITRIDSSLLAQYNSAPLSDILQLQMPLYFRNYGQGQLNSVTLRGTSANHTAVLWNGFAVNSPTAGSSDFSILPAFGFSQVEIQHGNSAAKWGSGAIGGSVLLGSVPVFKRHRQISFQSEWGSFGLMSHQLQTRFGNTSFAASTSIWQNAARNDFPYRNDRLFGSPQVRQDNAAFRQWGFTQDLDWKPGPGHLLSGKIWYTHTYRQVQPAMTRLPGADEKGDWRIDDAFRALLGWQIRHKQAGETYLKAAYFREALNWIGQNSPVQTYQAQAQHEIHWSDKLFMKAGGEFQLFQADIAQNYRRSESRQSFFLLTRWQPIDPLELSLNLRQAWVTGFDPPFTPNLGLNYRLFKAINQQLILKANAGRGYRVPTLHDRFWTGDRERGNPAIRPEESTGYETGLRHEMTQDHWQVNSEMTYYYNQVSHWIQWTPDDRGGWSPRNLPQVQTRGLEFSTAVTWQQAKTRIRTGVQYYFNSAGQADRPGNQLAYTPLHTFLITSQLTHRDWFGNLTFAFTGTRYQLAYDPADNPFALLRSYALSHVSVGRTFVVSKVQLQAVAKINNIFNTFYQTYEDYAMPGRHYSVCLRFRFGS